MGMLLSLDKISRLANILASLFSWILLAGFIIFPATFTHSPSSSIELRSQGENNLLLSIPHFRLVMAATGCCAVGYLGNLWMALHWRHNYVWLLNKLYLPGALSGAVGLLSALTNIYAQQRGAWSVTAVVAVCVETATILIYALLFFVYKNILLRKIIKEHHAQVNTRYGSKSFLGTLQRFATEPPVAPGSVV
jgi:hypothetical protein